MTVTSGRTAALHFAILDSSLLTSEEVCRRANFPEGTKVALAHTGSFLEWGERRWTDIEAVKAFGWTDRGHGVVEFEPPFDAQEFGTLIYQVLLTTGVADPSGNCQPSTGYVPFAITDAEDWSEDPR